MKKIPVPDELQKVIRLDQDILRIKAMGTAKRFELSFVEKTHAHLFVLRLIERFKRRLVMFRLFMLIPKIMSQLSVASLINNEIIEGELKSSKKFPKLSLKNTTPISSFAAIKFPLSNVSLSRSNIRIAVVLHGYYVDELSKMLPRIKNIPIPFKTYISTNTHEKKDLIAESLRIMGLDDSEIRVTPNKGRDIAPFLIGFSDIFDKFDYVLHLHTKKSPHDQNYAYWGEYLIQNLIGSPEIVLSALKIFEEHPHIGMIAPEHYHRMAGGIEWGPNYYLCKKLLNSMGVLINEFSALDFPSGSMFWTRTDALKPLLNLSLKYEDFPDEAGQVDGTMAHAIERLFFYSCELQNFTWIRTLAPTYQEIGSREMSIDEIGDVNRVLLG